MGGLVGNISGHSSHTCPCGGLVVCVLGDFLRRTHGFTLQQVAGRVEGAQGSQVTGSQIL